MIQSLRIANTTNTTTNHHLISQEPFKPHQPLPEPPPINHTMPPKRSPNTPAHSSSSSSRALAPATTATEKLRAAYDVLTAKENQSVVRSVALFGVSRGVCFSDLWAEGAMGGVEEEEVGVLLLLLWVNGVERGECAGWRIGKGRILRGFKKLIYTGNNRSRWRSSRVAGVRCCCRRESSLFAPLFPWGREAEMGWGWKGETE